MLKPSNASAQCVAAGRSSTAMPMERQGAALGRRILFAALVIIAGTVAAARGDAPPPLPVEPTGIVETLPERYPEDWFLVHDSGFFHMSDGKVYVIDSGADSLAKQVKGSFNNALMGNTLQIPSRGEIMSVETFHERGTRGARTDVLTIWDTVNLSPQGEVLLPRGKRFMGMPQRNVLLAMNDDRWLAIFNFSPATSVTLVDLEQRSIIAEIPIPGCSFLYAQGTRGFSSLCADGRFLTVQLDETGSELARQRSEVFFDSDTSPIFERAARVGDTAYFPSFSGLLHPVSLSGDVARPQEPWSLIAAGEESWAPSGIQIEAEDDLGRIYFLMNPEARGVDGKHNEGGAEIWVYDPAERERVQRIALREWGLSFAVSRGQQPKVLVTNPADMSVELYDGLSGDFIRKITGFGQETPLFLWGAY